MWGGGLFLHLTAINARNMRRSISPPSLPHLPPLSPPLHPSTPPTLEAILELLDALPSLFPLIRGSAAGEWTLQQGCPMTGTFL